MLVTESLMPAYGGTAELISEEFQENSLKTTCIQFSYNGRFYGTLEVCFSSQCLMDYAIRQLYKVALFS